MRTSPASGSVPEPLRVTGAPWATLGLSGLRPPRAPHQSHLFLGSCLRGIAGHPPRRPSLKTSPSRSLPSLSALTWRQVHPLSPEHLCVCWMPNRHALPIGQVAIKLALSFGVAIGQHEKNGLYLLFIFDIAFCLVTLVHCALVVDSATGVHC